ncbi:MAG: xanthine dehydrogenase family protein molybdopterin-binding subunit [Pyrinomonadaceae bacterium]
MASLIGKATRRVDGIAKVTGRAKYAAEFNLTDLAHGYLALSAVAKGRIASIDISKAEKAAGVIKIFTHKNAPKLPFSDPQDKDGVAPGGKPFRALQSDQIMFSAQPIALVVAETFEQARHAARLIEAEYEKETSETDILPILGKGVPAEPAERAPKPRGNPEGAFRDAPVKIEAEYTIPIEHHNAMEPHASIAFWKDDRLTVFDKTQWVYNVRNHLASIFGIPEGKVDVISPFVGGAFGGALRPAANVMLAAMAAREIKRPVKIVYSRRQLATAHGYRPQTWQKVRIGADEKGKFLSIIHEAIGNTSQFETYSEGTPGTTRSIYACPNVQTDYKIVKTDLATPLYMRAPGAVSGMFALESAIDELAYKLKIDPLELRLINYAETDPEDGKPFSSKALRECYSEGAERFGWSKRKLEPRSMRDGPLLVGWGVATGTWGAYQAPSASRITLKADGTALIQSAASDMGPGTYTTITMIAADTLGLPVEKVRFELGDSRLPEAPVHGGSMTTASVGSSVQEACRNVLKKMFELARKGDASPFKNVPDDQLECENGQIRIKGKPGVGLTLTEVLRRNGLEKLEEMHNSAPNKERDKYSIASHGAQFVEVKVDEDLGTVRVTRIVEATAAGRIMNPATAHSQEMGGAVWGIGMALTEETEIDHRYGRMMNPNLAGYHVPANADVREIETIFVEEEDKIVNDLGVKGMGELGMVGVPAAIANAVFHATGRRVRDLPITPDKMI